MIFVTVGTHEQGMERLFKEIDRLIDENIIKDKVFAQIGYTKYEPRNFEYKKMISYDEMDKLVRESEIVITHGGPGSIFHPLGYGKIPIVVPRDPKFDEHVDDHQILFAKRLESSQKIIGIYEICDLADKINNYNNLRHTCSYDRSNVNEFVNKFDTMIKSKFNLK